VFVGSFNFDPRSARLNTELGFVIDSPALAQQVAAAFTDRIPDHSYRVALNEAGSLQWSEQSDGRPLVHNREPGTGLWLRLAVSLMGRLPVEWLL
jgi:putative cardiolipin synthase